MAVSLLALDLGKTSCRARLCHDGRTVQATGLGAPGLAAPGGAARGEAAVLALALPLLRQAGLTYVDRVGVAAAGALAAPAVARELAARLCDCLPAGCGMVCSDATAAHAGALSGGPGVVLAIGTGAVAMAVGADGAAYRADGWGSWLGDEGGGAWLGLQGLRAAMRDRDGSGPATLLRSAAEARFGPLPALAATIEGHTSPARLAASFAPDLVVAAGAGDAVATALLGRAAAALAATATAAAARLPGDSCDLAITGGLVALGPALMDALVAALPSRLRQRAAAGTPLHGTALLACDATTIHEAALHRAERATPSDALGRLAPEAVRPDVDNLDPRSFGTVAHLVLAAQREAQEVLPRAAPQLATVAVAAAQAALAAIVFRVNPALVALMAGIVMDAAGGVPRAVGCRLRDAIARPGRGRGGE